MTPTPIAEVRIPVVLDRERTMIFNLNTMAAYEQATGKFYFDTLLKLYEIHMNASEETKALIDAASTGNDAAANLDLKKVQEIGLGIIRQVSMQDLRALIWAAVHEYDDNDNPKWPLTIAKVGRLLTPLKMPALLRLVVQGNNANNPTKAELGEASGAAAGPVLVEAAPKPSANGGAPSIELPADAFA